jgi:hypothetical protein
MPAGIVTEPLDVIVCLSERPKGEANCAMTIPLV